MSLNSTYISSPRLFLSCRPLVVGREKLLRDAGPDEVSLQRTADLVRYCDIVPMDSGRYYEAEMHRNGKGDRFLAYFLTWSEDRTAAVTLGTKAKFFFTSSLSGCSVSVVGPPDAPTVFHANAKGISDTTQAQEKMDSLLPKDEGVKLTKLKYEPKAAQVMEELRQQMQREKQPVPEEGMVEPRVTVVGAADDGGKWTFYYQQWAYYFVQLKDRSLQKQYITITPCEELYPAGLRNISLDISKFFEDRFERMDHFG